MTHAFRLIATFVLAASTLAGCASSPTPRFYVLGAPPQPAVKAVYSVAIGPVTVPDIVDRPQIVLRTAANEVTIPDQVRWAEPLKSEIPRVIAADIALSLGDAYVSAYPQATGSEADYLVVVDIQRFESALGEAATVEAQWTVRGVKDKSGALRSGRSVVREPTQGNDYDALVAAHGRALAKLSRDIAEAVRAARAAQ
jgi:uncharacterized protein